MVKWNAKFSEKAYEISNIEVAVKLVTTFDRQGRPHITLITFNRAKTPDVLVWGQFTDGLSKKHVFNNPKQGILIMTATMPFRFVQAKVEFTHDKIGGEDCEYFSRLPLLRYATYFNVWRSFYNDVKSVGPVRNLNLLTLIKGMLISSIAKGGAKSKNAETKLQDFGFNLFNGPINPKFLSYIDPSDNFPVTIPCFQIRAPDRSKLIFTLSQFKEDLLEIPEESKVAVFGLNFDYENLLIKGIFIGFQKFRGIKCGIIEIEEIYNSMPPHPGTMYPKLQVREKVTDFHL
ncbi:MAG: hypothetical protein ACTSVY_08705 [Candidatus Helarchaeota archaeon]